MEPQRESKNFSKGWSWMKSPVTQFWSEGSRAQGRLDRRHNTERVSLLCWMTKFSEYCFLPRLRELKKKKLVSKLLVSSFFLFPSHNVTCQCTEEVNHPPYMTILIAPSEGPPDHLSLWKAQAFSHNPLPVEEQAPVKGLWSASFGTSRCSGHLLHLTTWSGNLRDGTGSPTIYPYVLLISWETEQPPSRLHQESLPPWLPFSPEG